MYACICHAVDVADVELAVMSGASCLDDVARSTDAGSGCGCCHEVLHGIIDRVGCPLMALRS